MSLTEFWENHLKKLLPQGIHMGKIHLLIEMEHENGLDDSTILKRLRDKVGVSSEKVSYYLKQYKKFKGGGISPPP